MAIFEKITMSPSDPILGLNLAYQKDSRTLKVNLGIGAYKTEELQPFVFSSVRKAEELLLQANLDKEYLPIIGDKDFIEEIGLLLFGEYLNPHKKLIGGVQTIGGTGALRLGAGFLANNGLKTVYVPHITWPNHKAIFSSVNLEVKEYPYFDALSHSIDYEALIQSISRMEPKSVILLQACCHNPTGLDPTKRQWLELSRLIAEQQLYPFIDFAYQGFGRGLEEDRLGLEIALPHFEEWMVAYSCSKNFGLYGERVGALFAQTLPSLVDNWLSQVKVIIRQLYSSPPSQGARIVKTILKSSELTSIWKEEVSAIRMRLKEMREALLKGLEQKGVLSARELIEREQGMFSYLSLSLEQVERLKEEFGIYLAPGGRISIAGLCHANLDYVINAIAEVKD